MMDMIAAAAPRFLEILWLNIILSGDNAVVIGLAAAGLPPPLRRRAVLFGVVAAAVLRIIFSLFATYLLDLWWVALAGGVALLWIALGFLRELRSHPAGMDGAEAAAAPQKTLAQALGQIVLADVSMSLDNVLAVGAVARGNLTLLVVGLLISILLMGLLGGALARLLDRHRWIAYAGVALIIVVAGELIWDGAAQANAVLHLGLPLLPDHG
jgi:YjbE family integral membrane protein